jgi:D-serine deaminase-like pyridoxal phosphate-dependent protein
MQIRDLETPAVIIDLDILQRNIQRMQKFLTENGIQSRPHIKTHKIPAIAHMQVAAGAVGITCQKLSEAEVMVNSGLTNILVPYNIVGPKKLDRLVRLAKRADISVTVDSKETLEGISAAAREAHLTLKLLVECDTGAGRAGVQNPKQVLDLAKRIDSSESVCFEGLLTFKGGAPDPEYVKYTDIFFRETLPLLEKAGLEAKTVSSGGTVYAPYAWPEVRPYSVTECRPGVYVYYDRVKVSFGVATQADCAMRIITTVVSRPTPNRAIIDGGTKTFTQDGFQWVSGYGDILEYPKVNFDSMSEEHGHLDLAESIEKPKIGERLTIIPNYCNGVTNLHEVVYGVCGQYIEAVWPVAARGKIQ